MKTRNIAAIGAGIFLVGCQMQPSSPTNVIEVAGDYQAVADCFYLKVRGEGMWSKDDLPSQNAAHVRMGTERFEAGRIEFVGIAPDRTQATFLIAHPNKFEPQVRGCAGGRGT